MGSSGFSVKIPIFDFHFLNHGHLADIGHDGQEVDGLCWATTYDEITDLINVFQ
jgi:hypothetical protein